MPSGEIPITCPNCQHSTSLPVAAVKRDNYYCSRCLQKIPMRDIRFGGNDTGNRAASSRPTKNSRHKRR
jgi:hypothetical protein